MGGPGGMGRGDGPPGHGASRPERGLDELLPPNPWRLWQQRLSLEQGALALKPAQAGAWRAFTEQLDVVQRLSAERVRAVTLPRAPVSALEADVTRELRLEAEAARGWADAQAELLRRWQAALAVLEGGQRARDEGAWLAAFNAPPPAAGPRRD